MLETFENESDLWIIQLERKKERFSFKTVHLNTAKQKELPIILKIHHNETLTFDPKKSVEL